MDGMKMVLLVDDEPDLREMMAFQFKARGFRVATAGDGVEALERLKGMTPDLIVLDLNMPRMGGIEVYQHLCGSEGKPSIPVLVLTARANTEQMFRDLDIDGFMTKPFEVDALVSEAETIIRARERRKGGVGEPAVRSLAVTVADDQTAEGEAIALELLRAGYRVSLVRGGTAALEALAADPPALALVRLGMQDIAGDLVALRALRMARTGGVRFLLFEQQDARHLKSVRERLADKSGIAGVVEFISVGELAGAVDAVLRQGKAGQDGEA